MSKSLKSCILILLVILLPVLAIGQNVSVYDGLSVKGQMGFATLNGDVTEGAFSKMSDAKFGFGLSAIKMFSPFFGIEVRYAASNLGTTRADLNEQYTGQVAEIGLAARIEPLPAVGPDGIRRLYPYLRMGVSNASYRAIRWNTVTQQVIDPSFGYRLEDMEPGPRENTLSFPMAIGVGIRVNSKMSVELEYNHSILNTDYLDALKVPDGFNDMFGLTSIGLRYSFQPASQPGVPKPKERQSTNGEERLTAPREQSRPVNQAEKQEENLLIDPFKNEIPISSIFVESIVPDYPVSGELFEVLLKINKGKYTGPARIVHTLPQGFSAIESPLRHVRMEFKNQQAILTWDQMPMDTVITIRYPIHISEKVSGPNVLKGRIYYTQPEGSKSYQFVNQVLVTNRHEIEMDRRFSAILSERKSVSQPYSTSVATQQSRQPGKLDQVVDDLLRNYEETGTVYTNSMSNPVSQDYSKAMERQLVPEDDLDQKIQNLIGVTGSAAARPNLRTASPGDDKPSEYDLDRMIQNLIQSGNPSGATPGASDHSSIGFYAKPGVEFRIQVGAFRSQGEYRDLLTKYRISETVAEEYHNGLYKYTVGSFRTYREAQQFRDDFVRRTNLLSVFIVGYVDGVRQNSLHHLK